MTSSGKLPQIIQVGRVPETKMTQKPKYYTDNNTTRTSAEKEDATDTIATATTISNSKAETNQRTTARAQSSKQQSMNTKELASDTFNVTQDDLQFMTGSQLRERAEKEITEAYMKKAHLYRSILR